ncbi:histone deacetylase complex subunit SAP30L [Eurytemora carolleeae]|uniref:histone deacetylase complex subunit SAP30L n=1 Tax=Eurytemora carolleeae TaxID=1294199 RepID=UPI000C75CB18|nr:histone deacetylase complex subunit SAP30L [Eurytemora carolleeae]|eukprot:XP_023323284.1 histone deacetylase complex subunit SAP30L-like [Eurytemora affinis]
MSNVDRRVNGFMNEEEGGSRVHSLGGEQHCCLLETGRRCSRLAGNASYSKRIQKTVAQRKLKLSLDQNSPHIYICEFHKSMIQTVRVKRKRRESEESGETDTNMSDTPDVDLFQLQMNTLRRYKKHFKVTSRPGINKTQLADSLTR